MDLEPPQLPDLTLLRRIGGGSYGDVWLARTVTGVYRAVKIVDRKRFVDDKPFLRELDGITQFQRLVGDRPRQLALMHVGRNEEKGVFFYVMELADDIETGTDIDPERYTPFTLKALRDKSPVVPAADCIRYGVELARSLVELHAVGLIHRDIKLSNVIFVAGVPKLADIGLVSTSRHDLTLLGTPGYAPPEGAINASADIYGLGKVLYELATGLGPDAFPRLPPDIETREDAALLLELNEIILRACDPIQTNRYPAIGDMLSELLLLQAGKSVKELQRTRERLRTARQVAGIAMAVGAVVAAIFGVENHLNLRAFAQKEAAARKHAEEDERFARYRADLNRAMVSLLRQDIGQARAALRHEIPASSAVEDPRGLEWYALWNEARGDETRLLGKVGEHALGDMVLSPDGSYAATLATGSNSTITLWDLRSGMRKVLMEEATGIAGFSSDSSQLIVGTGPGRIGIVDTTGQPTAASLAVRGAPVGILADGLVVPVLVRDPLLEIDFLDLPARMVTSVWKPSSGNSRILKTSIYVAPSAAELGVGLLYRDDPNASYELQVWEKRAEWTLRFRRDDLSLIGAIDRSPDGSIYAVAGPETPLTLVDAVDGHTLRTLGSGRANTLDVAFSPTGTYIARAADDQTLRVWRVNDGTLVDTLRGHEGAAQSLCWRSPTELVSAGTDGTVRTWHIESNRPRPMRDGFWTLYMGDFVFGEDSRTLFVTGGNQHIAEVEALTLEPTGREWPLFHPLFIEGGRLQALTSDLELAACDLATGQITRRGLRIRSVDKPNIVTASPCHRFVLIGSIDGGVEFWDVREARSIARSSPHAAAIFGAGFSPDGELAVTCDSRGGICLWKAATAELIRQLDIEQRPTNAVALSSRGHVAIARADGALVVYDLNTSSVIARDYGHSLGVNVVAFSPDEKRLITAGHDGNLTTWSVPDYREQASFPIGWFRDGLSAPIQRPALLRFSPDGNVLATFTEAGWVRRWDLRPTVE